MRRRGIDAAVRRGDPRHRAAGRQAGRAQRAVRQRHHDPRRHHRPQRGDRHRAAREGGRQSRRAGLFAHRDHVRQVGHVRDVRRVGRYGRECRRRAGAQRLGNDAGEHQRSGFADPNLRPNVVGVFTSLTGPAPQGLSLSATIDTRFSTTPTALKLTAMVVAIIATVIALIALWRLDQLDGRRMQRLIPSRWRTFTTVDAVVVGSFLVWHVIGANSSDDGYILADGPRRRPGRLHVELLPLVRQPRGPVRLVLQPARADDARQRREHLDALARPGLCAGVLAAAVPRGAAAARARRGVQQGGAVGGRTGAAGRVDAVQQRAPSRGADRDRRADHLRADRAGHHLGQAHPCRAGDYHRRVHARHPADGPDRRRRAAGRRAAVAAHPGAAPPRRRHVAAGAAAAGRRARSSSRWCSPTRRLQRCWRPPRFVRRSAPASSGGPRTCATTT